MTAARIVVSYLARIPYRIAVVAAGTLAVRVPMLLAVCCLAGCGQRGPLTLPVPENVPASVPAAEPVGEQDARGAAENEADERDSG